MESEKKPCFAVCLAAYNGIAYIEEQIESILLQKNIDLKIFISVDKSTDGTEVRLAEWVKHEPRLTLLPFGQRFGGAGPNFFRLLREVDLENFDYLSFADQDDIWKVNKVEDMISIMEKVPLFLISTVVLGSFLNREVQEVTCRKPKMSVS